MDISLSKKVLVTTIIILVVGAGLTPSLSGKIEKIDAKKIASKSEPENVRSFEAEEFTDETQPNFKINNPRQGLVETFLPTDDAHADEHAPNNNEGYIQYFKVRRGGTGWKVEGLIKFDMSLIPPGTTINSATVNLYYSSADSSPAGRTINFHRILSDWDEGTVTWNTRPGHHPTVSASNVMPGAAGVWMQWDVTSDVQGYVDGSLTFYGWKLIDPATGGSLPLISFRSKEYADSSYYPYLEVDYEGENDPLAANWLGEQQITTSGSSENSVIACDSSDNLHIVWQDDRDTDYEIYYKQLDSDGFEVVSDTRLTPDDGSASQWPAVGIDAADEVHIVWQDLRDGNWEIYYTKLGNDGSTLVDDTKITDNPGGSAEHPVLGISEDNNVHVAWQDLRDGNYEIYYKKLDNNGNELTSDARVTEDSMSSIYPSLDVSNDTQAHIAWQDDRDGNFEIYYDDALIEVYPESVDYVSSDADPEKWHLAQVGVDHTIEVSFANYGEIDVTNVEIEILVDGGLIHNQLVDIDAGSSTLVTCSWIPSIDGEHEITAWIDPLQELSEYNRDNNEKTISVPVVDPSQVYNTLWLMTPEVYTGTYLACKSLYIEMGGGLELHDSYFIVYGNTPEITIDGGMLVMEDSELTTSHESEYIQSFSVSSGSYFDLTGCTVNRLGGSGIILNDMTLGSAFVTDCTIQNSEHTAFTLTNTVLPVQNSSIIKSGVYDFVVNSGNAAVYDCFYDRDKVQIIGSGQISYSKHIGVHLIDEYGNPAVNAYVEIQNNVGTPIWIGFTDGNGDTSPVLISVYQQDELTVTDYGPFTIYSENQSSGAFSNIYVGSDSFGGLYRPGDGKFGGGFNFYIVTKYALLIAGLDNSGQTNDRSAYWNDIEYMYHVCRLHGCRPENIQVVFMSGKDDDFNTNAIINYSANESNVKEALKYIGGRIQNNYLHKDRLLIFTTDHGGSNPATLCMQTGSYITDSEFAQMIDKHIGNNASLIYIAMGQCHSGGFFDTLHGPNRTVMTAANESQYSWWYHFPDNYDSNSDDGHSYFMVELISALHNHQAGVGNYPDNDLSNAQTDYYLIHSNSNYRYHSNPLTGLDDDSNGIVSIHEAFDYAHDNDLKGYVDGREGAKERSQEVDDDVVVAAGSYGRICVYWYDGDGTLSGKTFDAALGYSQILVADMDYDGYDDIIGSADREDEIHTYLSKGSNDWTFSGKLYYCSVGNNPRSLTIADFDRDGWKDVATANADDDDISVCFNNLDGTLGSRVDYKVGDYPNRIVASNIDSRIGDLDYDLIVTNWYDSNFTVLFNDGTGKFTTQTNYTLPGQPTGLVVNDIDNDGDTDIIVTTVNTYSGDKVVVFKNGGMGTFTQFATYSVGNYPLSPYLVDLDDDGYLDLLVIDSNDDRFRIYNNTGDGSFNLRQTYFVVSDGGPHELFATDLDGDEDPDIVVVTSSPDGVWVFVNRDTNNQGRFLFDSGEKTITPYSGGYMRPYTIHGSDRNRSRKWYL